MQSKSIRYLHVRPDAPLPDLPGLDLFKAVVIIDADVQQIWQWDVSRWLVSSGCRYLLAWGKECASWSESVDEANLERHQYEEIPEDQVVMTTSHEDEELSEAFWFAKHRARHPVHDLTETLVLHISDSERREEIGQAYAAA